MACTSATTPSVSWAGPPGGGGALGQGREAGQLPTNSLIHRLPEHGGAVGVRAEGAAQLQQAHHHASQGGEQGALDGRELPGANCRGGPSYTHSEPRL